MSDDLSYFGNLSRFSDTPTLVFSQRKLEESLQRIRRAAQSFSAPARIFFALKSCPLFEVARVLTAAGLDGFELHAFRELELVNDLKLGGELVFVGSEKNRACLEASVAMHPAIILDSFGEVEDLLGLPEQPTCRTGLRLTLATWGENFSSGVPQKLGLPPEMITPVLDIFKQKQRTPPSVLHVHGLGRCNDVNEIRAIAGQARSVWYEGAGCFSVLDIGGGLDSFSRTSEWTRLLAVWAEEIAGFPGLQEVWLEPGRALVEDAAVMVTRVLRVKQSAERTIVICDASTNTLVPIPMARFEITPISLKAGKAIPTWVVDSSCSPASTFGLNTMPEVKEGDLLKISLCGAYTISFAQPLFHSYLPNCCLYRNQGNDSVIWDRTLTAQLSRNMFQGRIAP